MDTLEVLSAAVADWLTQEEQVLTRLVARDRNDPEVAERLRIWTERLQAYERLELALAEPRSRAVLKSSIGDPDDLPDAVERGLQLVP
jgi:hypothetical protein